MKRIGVHIIFAIFYKGLFQILRAMIMTVSSPSMEEHLWLQKIYESRIVGKAFVKIVSALHFGITFYTFTADWHLIQWSSLLECEPKVDEVFSPSFGDVVVDVGAYVGRYTLKAAKSVGEEGLVIAVEPEPNAYRVLLENLKLNRIRNVRPVKIVLSNHNGICKFHSGSGPGWSSLLHETDKSTIVPCKTLDTLLDELAINRVNWVKVDVEGGEYRVLEGMTKTLQGNRGIKCIFEIHHNVSETAKVEPELERLGFKISHLDSLHILAYR